MNTIRKKTHIYTVDIRKAEQHPGLRVFVRAESKAQARGFIAATMIEVERTEQDDLLGLTRDAVIDATAAPAPAAGSEEVAGALPLPEPDPVDEAVRAFTDDQQTRTAAEEAGDTPA